MEYNGIEIHRIQKLPQNHQKLTKFSEIFGEKFSQKFKNFENLENLAYEKNVEFVDLVKRFPTVLRLLNLVSIQRRTDRFKFGNEQLE